MKASLKIFLAFLLVAGCEKIDTGKPSDCIIGRKYTIDNSLSFTIDSLKDYRCPKDVACIWSGDVDLHFSIRHNLKTTDTLIYLNTRGNNPFTFGGYTMEVKEVNPHLRQGEEARQGDYRIKMLITRN